MKVKMICLRCEKVVDRMFYSQREVKPIKSYCSKEGRYVTLYPIAKYIRSLKIKNAKLEKALRRNNVPI